MADNTVRQYREKLITELAYLIGRETQIEEEDFFEALRKAACVFPGGGSELRRFLAKTFDRPGAMVQRWLNGTDAPDSRLRLLVVIALRKELLRLPSG